MAVTLYTRGDCAHSRALRERLQQEGATFTEIDVEIGPERIPELLKLTGKKRIVPVLVDGARILVAPDGGTEF